MLFITSMINKKVLSGFSVLLILVFVGIYVADRGRLYKLSLFKSGQGWGYDVLVGSKPYIHQPFMPAFEGQIAFKDKRSARMTGKLVLKKLRKHQSPAITKEEMESLLAPKTPKEDLP